MFLDFILWLQLFVSGLISTISLTTVFAHGLHPLSLNYFLFYSLNMLIVGISGGLLNYFFGFLKSHLLWLHKTILLIVCFVVSRPIIRNEFFGDLRYFLGSWRLWNLYLLCLVQRQVFLRWVIIHQRLWYHVARLHPLLHFNINHLI